MPYKSLKDANAAIQGIKPPVTLAQANIIAAWADAIDPDEVKSPWAVALANFKKAYEIEGRQWVKRRVEEARGEGQGAGGEPQGDGGVTTCVCPDCGATATHERGTPCTETKCPECGATMMPQAEQEESDSLEEAGRRLNAAQVKRLRAAQDTINDLLKWADYADREPEEPPEEVAEAAFTESAIGHVLRLSEQLPLPHTESIVPLHLDVALITPGWGNAHDNHYYPADVVERDAGIFAGVKMYETDHRPNEKSTRTWVSTVKEIKGFTPEGSPIGMISVHDKNFAERLVALAADDLLEKMECSILANGTAKKGKIGDRKGRIVEAITSADSVDWVTRAGAGGRALALSESEEQEESMDRENEEPTDIEEQEPELEESTFSEQEDPEEAPAPEALAPERVKEMVEATKLPDVSKAKLIERDYQDEDALEGAIGGEVAYIKELTGGGRPFAQSGNTPNTEPLTPEAREEQSKARFNRIMGEVGLKEVA